MKRALVTTGLAALLLLTGCTAAQEAEPAAIASEAPAGTTAPTPSAPDDTPAPAAPVEVTATTPPAPKVDDVLAGIQITVAGYDVVVNADQIKSAANYTCDQLDSGADKTTIVALTGDIPANANRVLVELSANEYCPIR